MGTSLRFSPPAPFPLTAVSSQVLGENKDRKFLLLQNLSAVNVWVQMDKDAAFDECIRLAPGVPLGFDVVVPVNAIYARAETGTGKLIVTEG